MVTVKVFDTNGVREVNCFDKLDDVPYLIPEEIDEQDIDDTSADEI